MVRNTCHGWELLRRSLADLAALQQAHRDAIGDLVQAIQSGRLSQLTGPTLANAREAFRLIGTTRVPNGADSRVRSASARRQIVTPWCRETRPATRSRVPSVALRRYRGD
jgi:hypothetical protein